MNSKATKQKINQGFILAAGFGKRMMPLTAERPKPMVAVRGKPMIDHILDEYEQIGLEKVVINTHYKADSLEAHLSAHNRKTTLLLSHEKDILETGGGISNALHLLDQADFFVSSGDSYLENAQDALTRMQDRWNSDEMDILILLQDVATMTITQGVGDYDLDEHGRAIRSKNRTGRYMFTSLRINSPQIFNGAPQGAYSYLELLDRAESQGRLFGIVHNGQWHHISTPEDVRRINGATEGQ